MATDAENLAALITLYESMIAAYQAQVTAWIAAGSPPDFSIDGESYNWNLWNGGQIAALKQLLELIQAQSPYELPMRAFTP